MKRKLLLVGLVVASYVTLEAKYHKASGESSFNRVLDKNELVIAMFYHDSRDNREQLRDFKSAGRDEKYVAYVSVDLKSSSLDQLGDIYKVKNMPTFILFRNGRVYSERGQKAVITGEQGPSDLRNFVRDHFQDYIEDIREKKREEQRESRASVSFGVGYGYPYSYGPYYGYPYGYYGYPYYSRPGFSFGIGF